MKSTAGVIFLAFGLYGCAATTGNFRPISERYPARQADCDVQVFKDHPPTRPYAAISRLNVHLEKTFFAPSDFSSASGELKRQACLCGADAVIDIEEGRSAYLETRIYNLSATGVHFLDGASYPQLASRTKVSCRSGWRVMFEIEYATHLLFLRLDQPELGLPAGPFSEAKPILHWPGYRIFEVVWESYIGYAVQNESFHIPEPEDSEGEGRLFVRYTKSVYLDYLAKVTFASATFPGPFVHWGIYCLNHTIEVASMAAPKITISVHR